MIDQSPPISKIALWRALERASALQLHELAHEMVCAMHEVPQLQELRTADLINQAELAEAMAIAFEAGCNYTVNAFIDQSDADMQAKVAGPCGPERR